MDTLPSGALRVRVYAGIDPITGKRHYLTKVIPPGPGAADAAEKVRIKLLSQVDERRNPRTAATVSQLLNRYLDQFSGERSTLATYRRYARKHIEPLIGKEKVGAIDADVLDSFYAELRRCRKHCNANNRRQTEHRTTRAHLCDERCAPHRCEPLGASTVRQIHFILSGAFKRAVRWRWITVSPVQQAEPPPAPKPRPEPPSSEEAARILNEAWKDPDWGSLVWLTMTTGARRGEQCGLRWKHVDLEHGVLTYDRSIGQDEYGTWEKDTKSHQKRRVALDQETVSVLAEHWNRCQARCAALGLELTGDSFVFSASPDGSRHLLPASVTQRYARLAARLGIKTSIHKLRHYSATELIKAGVDVRTVAGRLGHGGGGVTTLRVYTAWVAEADQRAALSLRARMPPRPTLSDAGQRIRDDPTSPYERVAAQLFDQIASGELGLGDHLPPVVELAAKHNVSAGTAHRAVSLLKEWGIVAASRGKRAKVVALPTPGQSEVAAGEGPNQRQQFPDESELFAFRLRKDGATIRSFIARASLSDPDKLERLLIGAVRRLGPDAADLDRYELEVRRRGEETLLTTVVTVS